MTLSTNIPQLDWQAPKDQILEKGKQNFLTIQKAPNDASNRPSHLPSYSLSSNKSNNESDPTDEEMDDKDFEESQNNHQREADGSKDSEPQFLKDIAK